MAIFKNLKKALKESDQVTTLNIKVKEANLPEDLLKLPNLEALYIKSEHLDNLDFDFHKLSKLKVFYVCSKNLFNLSESILTHPMLETLSATGCQIKELKLKPNLNLNVKTLLVNKNNLEAVPKYLEHLESLENLNLSDNKLAELPEKLRLLNNLKTLSLNCNQLTSVPFELVKNWKSLHSLSLDGNKFNDETKELIEQELNYWFGEL